MADRTAQLFGLYLPRPSSPNPSSRCSSCEVASTQSDIGSWAHLPIANLLGLRQNVEVDIGSRYEPYEMLTR